MRTLCIVNPKAGGRTAEGDDDLDTALGILRAAGFDLEMVETGVEHPTGDELAERAIAERYEAVVVAGGDGTVQPVAAALLDSGITLGILPFGSYMNIANGIGLSLKPIEAAEMIAQKNVVRADVGVAGKKVFFETAGVGLDAEAFGAARLAERGNWRAVLRRVRRWAALRSHRVTVIVDGEPHRHRVMQILITNSPFYLWSFPVVPGSAMDDGQLDVAVYSRMGRLKLARLLVNVWRKGEPEPPPVVYRGREIRLECDEPLPVHADGHIAGALPMTFTCRVGALAAFGPRPGERADNDNRPKVLAAS